VKKDEKRFESDSLERFKARAARICATRSGLV
jgi:hypothetical protein